MTARCSSDGCDVSQQYLHRIIQYIYLYLLFFLDVDNQPHWRSVVFRSGRNWDVETTLRKACGEQRLSVAVGEAVLVSKSEGSWAHGFGLGAMQLRHVQTILDS